jgi:fibronectin-binding autotransporter adhesin
MGAGQAAKVTGRCGNAWAGVLVAAAACLLPASVRAAEFTWSGATDGDWGVATNWNATPTFDAGANIIFYATGADNLNTFMGDAVRTIGGLTFNDSADSDIIIRTYSNNTGSGGNLRTLTFNNGAGNASINVDSGVTGNITIAPGGGRPLLASNLVIDHNGSGNLEIGMRIERSGTGTRSITKNGTGTLSLTNATASSTPFNDLIINAGKVRLAGQNAAGNASDTKIIMTGGTLSSNGTSQIDLGNAVDFSGNLAFGDATDTGIVNFTSNSITLVGNTTVNTISQLNLNGVVGGDFSLTKTGDGIVFMGSNANTFTGGLNIDGGTVQTGNNNGRLGASGGAVSFNGGVLEFTGGANAAISRTSTLNAGGGTIGVANASATITWNGNFTGDGGLTKTGDGTLVMDSSGAYAGGLNLNGGVVSVANANNRLGAGGGAVSFDGGTLLFRGTLSFSTGARATTLNAGGGTIDVLASAATVTWNGAISGAGELTKAGVGGLVLGGVNTYTGATTVSAGTLLVNGSTATDSAFSVADGAVIGGSGTIGGNLTLANGALFAFDPDNTLTLSGSSTFALDSSFGVASLRTLSGAELDWDAIGVGTYTLITGGNLGPSFFSASNIGNFGVGNALTGLGMGGTKSAYFQNGSLQLVVVPEPSTWALLGGVAAVGVFMMRRRRSVS